MADRTIVALYDRLDDAHAARDELIDMGILQDEITIGVRDSDNYRLERGAAPSRNIGGGDFLSALGGLNIPQEDAHVYAEAIRRGAILLTARVAEDQLDHALDILERHNPIDIDERATNWRSEGWTGYEAGASDRYATAGIAGTAAAGTAAGVAGAIPTPDITGTARTTGAAVDTGAELRTGREHEHEQAIPVVEEELQVGKRQVRGGRIRVHSHVVETPVHEQVQLREETVHVERRPVDRPAGQIPPDAFQEKTVEVTETREEPVVSKTAHIVEEVVVSKDVETHIETVSDTVRRTEVEVEDERDRSAATRRPRE